MATIDRYTLLLFARTFAICYFSVAGLIIIGHLFANIDEFIDSGKVRGGVFKVIIDYYGPISLSIYDRMSGTLCLMAVMFVIAWLYRTNEMTALLAAGISKGRVIRPLLIAAGVVFIIAAINREYVLPQFGDILVKTPQDLKGVQQQRVRPTTDQKYGILFSGRQFSPETNQIVDPIFGLFGPASVLGKQLTASKAQFLHPTQDHGQGFLMHEVHIPVDIDSRDSIQFENQDLVLTHKDTPWIQPGECFIACSIQPELLSTNAAWRQYASLGDIARRLRSQPEYYGADTRTAFHSRLMQPVLDMTLLLLGIPIVLSRPDRHLFWVAGTSLLIVGGFTAFVMSFQTLGASGALLAPASSVWLPILAVTPFAWARAQRAMRS